jgi:KDO2-lipid IV(A) lauroyltransferase
MRFSWRTFRQSLEYHAVRGALWLAGTLPIEAGQRVGAAIGRMGFDLVRARRSTSTANIEASLGVSRSEATKIARASYANLGRSLMEFSAFARLTRAEVLDLVSTEGLENLDRVRSAGKGGVLISGHLGNWELIAAALSALDRPVHGLIGQQSNTRVDDVMNDLRRRQDIRLITKSVALRKVLQVLKAGEFVVMLVDQDARKSGVFVEFLGQTASTVRGPALFAIRSGCPVLPTFVARVGTRHRLVIEEPIYPVPMEDEDEQVRDLTQRYTDRITARVRMHPDEYFWPHRRWKTKAPQIAQQQPVAGSA